MSAAVDKHKVVASHQGRSTEQLSVSIEHAIAVVTLDRAARRSGLRETLAAFANKTAPKVEPQELLR